MVNFNPAPDQTLQSAFQNHQAGRLPEAEALYRQVLQQNPHHVVALHLLGVLAAQSQRPDLAVDLIRQAIALRPNFPEAYTNLGNVLKDQGRLDEALLAYRQAIALKPNIPEAHNNLGVALASLGQTDEAVTAYRQAIALKPTYAEAYANLGAALADQGQFDAAIAAYRQAIALKPNYLNSYFNLGLALAARGQLDDAITAYRQAIALRPNYPEASSNLGNALLAKEQLHDAGTPSASIPGPADPSKTPVIWLECSAAIVTQLRPLRLIHTGHFPNPQTGIDNRLQSALRKAPHDRPQAFLAWVHATRNQAAASGLPLAIWHPFQNLAQLQALGFNGPILHATHLDEARSKLRALQDNFLDAAGNLRIWASHSGKFGDLLYGLPTLRAMGGGHLYLTPNPHWGMALEPRHLGTIVPLLLAQPYITGVEFIAQRPAHAVNLDHFRLHWNAGKNIAEYHLSAFNQSLHQADTAWLSVPQVRRVARVLFNRSQRVHNPRFPWKRIVEKYRTHAAFVGLPEEHQRFCADFGPIDYHPTKDFLELAEAIAGCELFVGNMSAALAVAEGLKVNNLHEVCPDAPDCIFDRPGAVAGWDENMPLIDLP